ncbi:MAG: hypothetical protein KAV80_03700 [Methanomicrobia archaeon]|nr:hypothetical protein [Methanomicrobia archaeon]
MRNSRVLAKAFRHEENIELMATMAQDPEKVYDKYEIADLWGVDVGPIHNAFVWLELADIVKKSGEKYVLNEEFRESLAKFLKEYLSP